MSFDFRGARLDPGRDRTVLGWMMNQFLYGEVTGIQCGHWLYDAPDLEAARFFSLQAFRQRPSLRRRLLGLSLVSTWGVRRLGQFMKSRLPAEHGVLSRLPEFLKFTVDCAEKRLLRMGVLLKPLAEFSLLEKSAAIAEAYGTSLLTAPLRLLPRQRLTETYLRDPSMLRARPDAEEEPIRIVR